MAFQFSIIGIGLIIQQNAVNGLDEINNNATSLIKDLYATSYVNACKINNFVTIPWSNNGGFLWSKLWC